MLRNRDYWSHAQIQALVSAIDQQRRTFWHRPQLFQQGPSYRRGMCVAGRQPEVNYRASIHSDQINLGVPSAAGVSLKWSLARRPRC